jgi:valyl-tRNA synthetase
LAILLGDNIDVEAELDKLTKELARHQGFLKGVMGKLNNEKFMSGAPEQVVAIERKKQADAEAKIKAIEEQMVSLKK